MNQTITDALQAVADKLSRWQFPVAVVEFADGEFEAVPEAHLSDISWCGRSREHEVIATFGSMDEVAEALAEAPQTTIYSRQITTNPALREGRAPSHDGEYLMLYYADGDWFLSGNGGPCDIDGTSDLRATVADGEDVDPDGEDAWKIDAANEAQHIIDEIALVEADPENTCDVVDNPEEALGGQDKVIAREMGWQWEVA